MVTAIDCRGVPSKMVRLGLSQIDLIIQILLFPLRVPRFLRDTPLPLAYGAENLRNPINLCEPITRICGFRGFCEKLLFHRIRGGKS